MSKHNELNSQDVNNVLDVVDARELDLMSEFDTKKTASRARANSIAHKLTEFLSSEIKANKKIFSVNALDLNVEKIHIATLYNALRENKIEIKRNETFVVDKIDNYYITKAIIKTA